MEEYRPIEHPVLWSLAQQNAAQVVRNYLSSHAVGAIPETILFELMLVGEFGAAETLIQAGVPVDGFYGVMPLLGVAVELRRRDIVEFLLTQGANPFLPVMPTSNLPLIAIDLAKDSDAIELVQLLSKYMEI